MRKNYSMALGLGALTAFLVVGWGVKPARADWTAVSDPANPYAPINLSIGGASASIGATGPSSDSTGTAAKPDPDSGPASTSVKFVWSGNDPVPSSVNIAHNINLNAQLASSLTANGPSNCGATFHIWEPASRSSNRLDSTSENSKYYDYYRTHSVQNGGTDAAVAFAQQSRYLTPEAVQDPDGTHYYINTTFNLEISSHAEIFSSYALQNYGYGSATVSPVTASTSSTNGFTLTNY